MKKKYLTPVLWIFLLLFNFGCDDFLSKMPSKSTSLVITTAEQLDAVLANYSLFYKVSDRNAVYATDDVEISPELFVASGSRFYINLIEFYLWDTEYIPKISNNVFWQEQYQKIFCANLVLQYLDEVSGSAELKASLRAEAHLFRADAYLELVNKYCLPFTENTRDEPGLPLKQATAFDELDSRSKLHEVYDLIETDIAEALKSNTPLVQNDGTVRHWRGNVAAANAFAARYWLGRNDYEKALRYADEALKMYNRLKDYNTEMKYSEIENNFQLDPGTEQSRLVTLKFPYTFDNAVEWDPSDVFDWTEFYLLRLNYNMWGWYVPSEELLDLYGRDTSDLRYRYHVVEGFSYYQGLTSPSYDYPGYAFFFNYIPKGPTVAEMYLTKAECLARSGAVGEAMSCVNILRKSRMDNTLPLDRINLSATTRDEAIKKILEERRREMPFSIRWFDIRRLNNNDDDFDDVVLSREFYPYNEVRVHTSEPLKTYTLEKNSRRYACPIPNTEIQMTKGKLLQNSY